MKIHFGKTRITLIPENKEDGVQLEKTLPTASDVLAFYTYDAGDNGAQYGLVITHKEDCTKNNFISLLGEGFHTAFRKAVGDSPQARKIHELIQKMPNDEWHAILEFVYDGIKPELK